MRRSVTAIRDVEGLDRWDAFDGLNIDKISEINC